MFAHAKAHYQSLTGMALDDSGSDIGRLCFTSYDPDIYINKKALAQVQLPCFTLLPPPPEAVAKSSRQLFQEELPGEQEVDCSQVDRGMQMEFQNCARAVQRQDTYQAGNRDNFIYALANKCYQKDLPEATVVQLARKQFAAPDLDVRQIVENAYREKTTQPLGQGHCARPPFTAMKKQHYNTMFYDLQMAGIHCQPNTVRSLVDSRYARDYNPFTDYFYGLNPYDGTTDYIAQLAATIQTTDQPFWEDCLRRWIAGLVACALDDDVVNQLAIVLKGAQVKGKSTWIRHLLPPFCVDTTATGW